MKGYTSDGKLHLNAGEEDEMEIWGYRPARVRVAVTWMFIVLTVGLLRLVFHWKPEWMLKCMSVQCPLADACQVLLKDQYGQWYVHTVKLATTDGNTVKKPAHSASAVSMSSVAEDRVLTTKSDGEVYLRYFVNKKIKYLWDAGHQMFEKLRGLEENQSLLNIDGGNDYITSVDNRGRQGVSCSIFHQMAPLSPEEKNRRRVLFGPNAIVVRVTPIIKILFTQVLNPFYVFQLFSVILWFNDQYTYYAAAILIISVISLAVQVYETRTTQRALKHTISSSETVSVCDNKGVYHSVLSDDLVPGDIIEIPRQGCNMQCDAVLLTGNCIVNESMLTGESVPVTKTPIPNPSLHSGQSGITFDLKDHSRHVLFCGTQVIQTRYYGDQKVKAIVLRTGFATAKGELVRSILFPKPVDFKFTQDSFKFIGVLALISCAGMIYTLVLMIRRGDDASLIVLRTLDLVTIVIPPALPAAMTIGIVFAQTRLKTQRVFCISPRSINLCGAINAFCFDKTGTLTEDGLDLWGIVRTQNDSFIPDEKTTKDVDHRDPFLIAMATCHSLTIIEGELSGDPLDQKMFDATNWDLEEPGEDTTKYDVFMPTIVRPKTPDLVRSVEGYSNEQTVPYDVGILRQFTFSSRLQRMSVIARTLGSKHFDLYAKGAPEMITSLCRPETVPLNFHEVLTQYTQQGYRVIALAYKPLRKLSYVKVQRIQREQVEVDMIFLGLLVMENRLKPETTPVVHQLKSACIRTIMVTGDNMLTALSVARDCHIVDSEEKVILVQVTPPDTCQPASITWSYAEDASSKVEEVTSTGSLGDIAVQIDESSMFHFAVTGKTWSLLRQYFPELLPKLVVRGSVFARFSPEQKQLLVETLQEIGYYVGMCGDGANDCGALKTAHTGISLSEAEASVASPFTSKDTNISCVPTVIREGRAALVTSFGVFKYMACYSLTQFTTVCLLYWIGANLTDFTFLYIDLVLLTSLGITFGYTGSFPYLVPRPPAVSLLAALPIGSLALQVLVNIIAQLMVWYLTQMQVWFEPFEENEDEDYMCHEVTTVFFISMYQYATMAIVFSKGAPYRKSVFTNYLFMGNIIIVTAVNIYVNISPFSGLADLLELKMPPSMLFRGLIFGVAAVNFFLCFLAETMIVDSHWMRWLCDKLCHRDKKSAYTMIEEEIVSSPDWPPAQHTGTSLANLMKQEHALLPSPAEELHPASFGKSCSSLGSRSSRLSSVADDSCESELGREADPLAGVNDALPMSSSTVPLLQRSPEGQEVTLPTAHSTPASSAAETTIL